MPRDEPTEVTMSFGTNPFLDADTALAFREWYVRVDGSETVGPVSADQIARGIRVGRVPKDALISRFDQQEWAQVLDSSAVVTALRSL
jgi:hypothetical protein